MKKQTDPDFLPEYDFSAGARGKYVSRLAKGTNIVMLDKDVQQFFPNSVAVNAALRALGKVVEAARGGSATKLRPVRKHARTVSAE